MGSTWTADGERVDFQWALVDLAGDVVVSHRRSEPTLPLEENPDFPQGLQPRDRERVASAMQIDDIKRNLEPLRLEESAEASNGAPILGPDRVTESGNGRLIALEELYREGKAGPYTDRLKATAASRGLPVAEVERMRWPAAVRVRTSPTTDRAELVKKFNAPTVAGMAASETAEADGDRLSPDLLSRLHVGENGVDLLSAANGPFVRAFLAKLTPNEAVTLVTADGVLNKDGRRRIEQALVGRAFGRSAVLEKITESADDNTRLVSSAILNSAPRMADVRAAIEQERLPRALDPTPAIEEAVQKLTWLREEGQSVEGYLQQSGLFGDTMTPAGRAVLEAFDEFARSGKKTTAFLTQLGHGLMLEANEKLLSDLESPPLADFVGAARRFVSDGGQSTLFGGPDLSAPDPVQPDSGGDGERGPSGPVDGGRRSARAGADAPAVADARHVLLVQRWTTQLSERWKDSPEIRVVSAEAELPEGVRSRAEEFGATGTIEGLYTGTAEDVVYVVAPMVKSKADAERIVLHEVMGHAG
ncbi:MAG TPA: hypothetical protein PLQ31_13115, partial [Thermoanaerobaculia bacterium]|nr:hypothetical protein [Thermoanaerobaculia bacterium]